MRKRLTAVFDVPYYLLFYSRFSIMPDNSTHPRKNGGTYTTIVLILEKKHETKKDVHENFAQKI